MSNRWWCDVCNKYISETYHQHTPGTIPAAAIEAIRKEAADALCDICPVLSETAAEECNRRFESCSFREAVEIGRRIR